MSALKRLLASLAIFFGGLGLFLSIWLVGFTALMRGWPQVSSPDVIWVYLAGVALFAASFFSLRFGIKSLREN
jgi:hypothetical protein